MLDYTFVSLIHCIIVREVSGVYVCCVDQYGGANNSPLRKLLFTFCWFLSDCSHEIKGRSIISHVPYSHIMYMVISHSPTLAYNHTSTGETSSHLVGKSCFLVRYSLFCDVNHRIQFVTSWLSCSYSVKQ